jgi:DNA-binding CsgD family transcriptional regulator
VSQLAEALRDAHSTAAIGAVVSDAAARSVGISAFSLLRVSGPVVTASDVCGTNSRESPERTRELLLHALAAIPPPPELRPFGSPASAGGVLDVSAQLPRDALERSDLYQRLWRPLAVERQLIGFLGTPEVPLGFVCAARSAHESPFTGRELAAFAEIRASVQREIVARDRVGSGPLEDALTVLARAAPAAQLLFDERGALLWLSDEARTRLSLEAAWVGASLAVGRSGAVEQVAAWVRAEARAGGAGAALERPPATVLGGPLVLRRFDVRPGRALYLVAVAGGAPPATAGSQVDVERARRLARAHRLTLRQAEVLAHVAVGMSNRAIAAALGCAEKTVEVHLTTILARVRRPNRAALAAWFWTA